MAPNDQDIDPSDADSPARYVALLRELVAASGLTYRQLQKRAESSGNVLAPSTLATALRRSTLPREEFVTTLVGAFGTAEQTDDWVRALRRLRRQQVAEHHATMAPVAATREVVDPATASDEPTPVAVPAAAAERAVNSAPAGLPVVAQRPWRRAMTWPLGAGLAAVLAVIVVAIIAITGGTGTDPGIEAGTGPSAGVPTTVSSRTPSDAYPTASAAGGPPALPATGPYLLHTLSGQCISERPNTDSGHLHPTANCEDAFPTTTFEVIDNGRYIVRTYHPVFFDGCMGQKPAHEGPQAATRPADGYCEGLINTTIELMATTTPQPGFRLRFVDNDRCMTVVGDDVLFAGCDALATDQVFTLRRRP